MSTSKSITPALLAWPRRWTSSFIESNGTHPREEPLVRIEPKEPRSRIRTLHRDATRRRLMIKSGLRVGIVGATGAVGRVTLQYLLDRGHTNIRTFASSRSTGVLLGEFEVEEATTQALGAGDLDVCFFSVGTQLSRKLVPVAAGAGALCVDKSSAFRLDPDTPLIVPEVNGARASENAGIIANPNCCTIPLAMALAPLERAAGLRSVRVATYQSVSGAGIEAIARLRDETADEHELRMDWEFDG